MGKNKCGNPRLMCITQTPVELHLSNGETVKGIVNYSDRFGRELIVADGNGWATRWVAHTDLKRELKGTGA